MFEAARITDPIAHTSALAGFITGAIIGIVLIAAVAFATFTCGFGVALLAGLAAGIGASAILGLGEAIGRSFSSPSGTLLTGSPNVFVNSLAATYATASTVACSKHNPVPLVAEGSSNVFINGLPAARKGDAITCGAKIDAGSADTFLGGGTVRYLPVDDEVPPWLRTAVDWAFALAGLVGGLAGLVKAAGGLSRAVLPCAAKFIGGFVIGEAAGRYVVGPVVERTVGGLFGHPVDVTTGRKLLLAQREVDFVVPSPIPVEIQRFYASNLSHEGALGRGWVLPWELRLQARDGQLWFTDAQGRETGFPLVTPGHTAFSETEQRYLACTHDGRYIVYDLNEQYFDFGTLDPQGSGVAWVQRLEDQTGQWQGFERDEQGRVTHIRTSGGAELRLHYLHLQHRLTRIEATDGGRRDTLVSYGYDAQGQLADVTDANGNVVRRFEYEAGLMVAHHNALGFECRYGWAEIEGQQRVVTCSTSEGEHSVFRYDVAGRQTWVEDELGRTAHWRYDEHFQVVECMDLDGGHYAVEYTEAGQPALLELPGDREVRFDYDAAGRIVGETDPLRRTTTTAYHANSLRVSELTLPDGSRWRAEHDHLGRLQQTRDPLGRTERYEYGEDLSPWPLAHIDARGGRKTLAWNRRGQLVSYTDCSGKSTHHDYDRDGQLVATINALGQRVSYQRQPTGEPLVVELPDGSQEQFKYDAAGLLVQHLNNAGDARRWQRNARGLLEVATDAAKRSLRYAYDAQGRLVALASDNGAAYTFRYDTGDRLAQETRPDGVERHLSYGESGELRSLRCVGSVEGSGSPSGAGVGGDGGSARGTAQSEAATSTGTARPQRTIHFERDAMGRLLKQGTATATTAYTWDAGDRLLQAERTPNEAGAALGVNANTVTFDYDRAGRLLAEHGSDGTVGYTLDELDNVTRLTLPHGPAIDTLHYGSGHVHQIRSGSEVISDFERDDLHREVLRTQGRLAERTGYDTLGRRSWQAAGTDAAQLAPAHGRLWRSYRYHLAGELAQQHDNVRGAIDYQYDPAGQLLTQTRQADHSQEQFAWDAAGNLLDTISRDAQRSSRGSVRDNRLRMWQDLRFEYDAWGNLATKRKGGHQTQHFVFDAEDRLLSVVTVSNRGRLEARFEYDALGRRIGKTDSHTEASGGLPYVERKRFVWQGLRLAQEVRETGFSSYVYSPDAAYTPLARLDTATGESAGRAAVTERSGTPAPSRPSMLYHFHTDLVGAPMELTDEAGELAWAGRYKAWGKVEHGEDMLLMARTEQPLRYPGQYADESTGLHYNTFRYYDPDVGRFVSQDPIGLGGGENLYAYAPNPNRWIDPLGWAYGGVDFKGSADLFPAKAGQSNIVEIAMQGARGRDFTEAYRLAGICSGDAADYTWHHVRDFNPDTGKTTMQLVRTSAHEATFPHAGSVEQFEKAFKVKYNSQEAVKVSQSKGWLSGRAPKSATISATGC